jgi:hypothetical protein
MVPSIIAEGGGPSKDLECRLGRRLVMTSDAVEKMQLLWILELYYADYTDKIHKWPSAGPGPHDDARTHRINIAPVGEAPDE